MLRKQRDWWDYRLWRAGRTVFFTPLPYRIISFFRRWAYDIIALVPLAAAGAWWITVSSGTSVPPASVSTIDPFQQFLLSHHVSRFYPTLIGLLLCVFILRTGRTAAPRRSRAKVSLAVRIPVSLIVFLLLLAVLDLILVPGSIAERAVPCVVAAAWGWLVRSVYGRVRVLEPTDAGFRPSARIAFSRKSRKFARGCLTSSWRYDKRMATERAGIDTAVDYFATRGDTRTLGWCVARGVDYNLRASALDEAEALLGGLARYRELNDDPCVRAAQGLFERATGTGAAGPIFADAERLSEDEGRRVPHRLRTLRAESELSWTGDGGRRVRRWTGRTRASLVWNREYATVLQDLLAASFTLERHDSQFAMVSVLRVEQLVNDLGKESARSDLTAQEANSLQLVRAAARERIGELRATQHRFREASASYAMAATLYRQSRYRPRAGFAAASAAILALRAGVAEDAKAESDLLDALLTGLQTMEYDRGRLRDPQYRSGLLAARDTLYSGVFAVLAERVTMNRAKAAELALWLLESVHRNALAENIQASQESEASGEALRRLREPADVAGIRQVVTGRAALYYRCERTENGWQVTTVLIAPSSVTLHRSLLPAPAPGTGRITAMRKLPAALLDELASGDPGRVSFVHTNIRLGSPVWSSLAQALLPSELADVLHSLESPQGPAILLIVPDGPLSSVPFAGMRLDDGSAVADHAAVVFMPNLLAFSANEWGREPDDPDCVAVAHFGPTMFKDAFGRLRSVPEFEPVRMTVRVAPDRDSFVSALAQAPPPRIAVISHHGETAADPADRFINFVGGGTLSEQDAENIRWPQTVVLGSCWASDITVRAGDDPLGLPTACLLGGASAVLGGQSQVDNDETSARILARVTLEAALGRHPALTLRNAIEDHLAARPADRDAPPAQWANMTVWTSRAPAGPVPVIPRWASWTTKLTARPPGEDRFAAFDLALLTKDRADRRKTRPLSVPIGGGLQRAIQHASGTDGPLSSVTSLELLAGIFATDNADWTSFTVAADLPALPGSGSRAGHTSREREAAASVITLGLDHQARVTAAVSSAFGWAERLAAHLGDPVIAPAHIVYGFLCEDSCDAARWMSASSHGIPELRSLLGDRVFSTDLPPAADLPSAQPRPGTSHLVRPRVTKRSSPRTSQEVLDLMSADTSGGRTVLSTLDFLGAVAAANGAAWRQLTEAGLRLSPPDLAPFAERGRGGREISLGDGYLATVTQEFAEAFGRARSLAYHLGDPEIGSAHMLYGILTDQGNDAARWLRPAESSPAAEATDEGAVAVLAARVFRNPLPPSHRLPSAPIPPGPKSSNWTLLLVPPLLLGMLLLRIRRKARASLAVWVLLGVLIVTMGLADINTSAPNSTQLVVERSALTGMVSVSGQAVPATLLGSLSNFYASPVIQGWRNDIRAAFSSWGRSPAALSGWYLFVLPSPPHPPAASAGWLSYRGARFRARVTCQGQIAQTACFALAQLPRSVSPAGFSWGTESYNGVSPGTEASQTALVYQGAGQIVGQANIEIYAETPDGSDILKVRDQSGEPIRPDSPVVLDDRSRVLPLFGIAIPAESGRWDTVYPLDLLDPYAEEIADKLAGPMPGAQAYAGVELGTLPGDPLGPALVSDVLVGSPADNAGIQTDDQIVAIDGKTVNGPVDVADVLSAHRPGQTVDVEILRRQARGYIRLTIALTLGYRPT